MKYIITESQKDKFITNTIQLTLDELKLACENDEDQAEWYDLRTCEYVDDIEKIVINDIEKTNSNLSFIGMKYPTFIVWVNVHYSSIFSRENTEAINDIAHRIFQKYKIKLKI